MKPETSTISRSIIAQLYEEALVLADEVRGALDPGAIGPAHGELTDAAQVALSCEALRTTTRMMHAIAWLLNQRAFHQGQMSEFQLRRHGRLPRAQPAPDTASLACLPLHVAEVIGQTVAFYARIERMDAAWRDGFELRPAAVHHLRERLGHAYAN